MVTHNISFRPVGVGSLSIKKIAVEVTQPPIDSWETLANTLRDRFQQHVVDMYDLTVKYPNDPANPQVDRWVEVEVVFNRSVQTHIPASFRTNGWLKLKHYALIETGDQQALEFLEWLKGPFRSQFALNAIRFATPFIVAGYRNGSYVIHEIYCPFLSEL